MTQEKSLDLGFYKVDKNAIIPTIATEKSACFDFYYHGRDNYSGYSSINRSFERESRNGEVVIMPGDRVLVPTGLIIDIPEGYSVRVHPRSGLSLKSGLVLANQEGVVDQDYVEEFYVLVLNVSENKLIIQPGDRIAQGELVPVLSTNLITVRKKPGQKSSRSGGMGSTGK